MKAALDALLKDFKSVTWDACSTSIPGGPGTHVYVMVVRTDDGVFPLYVGLTSRLLGRVGDYQAAQFQAPTDFRVGEAITYLAVEKKCQLDFLFRESATARKDEKLLVRELLLCGYPLLSFLGSFDYKDTTETEERKVVHRFCDMALYQSRIPSGGFACPQQKPNSYPSFSKQAGGSHPTKIESGCPTSRFRDVGLSHWTLREHRHRTANLQRNALIRSPKFGLKICQHREI
jgi:hypothetical protein